MVITKKLREAIRVIVNGINCESTYTSGNCLYIDQCPNCPHYVSEDAFSDAYRVLCDVLREEDKFHKGYKVSFILNDTEYTELIKTVPESMPLAKYMRKVILGRIDGDPDTPPLIDIQSDKSKRTHMTYIALNELENAKIREYAQKSGKSLSKAIRGLIFDSRKMQDI